MKEDYQDPNQSNFGDEPQTAEEFPKSTVIDDDHTPYYFYGREDEKQWNPPNSNGQTYHQSDVYDVDREDPFIASAKHAAARKKDKKTSSAKKFWRGVAFTLAGLMLIFSTATCAFLLKDNLSDSSQMAQQETKQIASSASDNVTSTSTGGSEMSVADINTKISPSVVLISGTSMNGTGQGTGVIISEDGNIMTNAHVVKGFSELQVTLNDEQKSEYPATIIGYDETTDLAVIKIEANGLTPAELGTSADLRVGQDVVVIGNPLGEEFSGSVTTGIISALDREVDMGDGQVYNYIQTDAAINSGNSGGPLVSMQGQVIGINSAKIDNSVAEGMGFAIPIDTVIPVVNDLLENGYVTGRPYIGIGGETLSEQYLQYYNLPAGVHVTSIASGSPAESSDLRVDDIITAINGTEITTIGGLNQVKNKLSPGDTAELTVYRYSTGETFTVKITLAEMMPEVQ